MSWLGKIVGGTIGFALGGPLGAIAGAAFGHTFDRKNERLYISGQTRLSTGEEAQFTFFIAAFSMLAKLAKADGDVSEEEIDAINKFMLYDLNLDPESRMAAMNIFNAAIESSGSFDDFAAQFGNQFHVQPQMLELMIDILLRVSIADGTMSESEERLIRSAVRIFNFSDERYKKLKSTLFSIFIFLAVTIPGISEISTIFCESFRFRISRLKGSSPSPIITKSISGNTFKRFLAEPPVNIAPPTTIGRAENFRFIRRIKYKEEAS